MPRLTPIARALQAWINDPDHREYTRRRKLALKKLDEMGLRQVSDANDEQQDAILHWIAGKP